MAETGTTSKPTPTPAALGRAAYRDVTLYGADRTPAPVDLSDNTNLWGVPPAATRAITEAALAVTRYPAVYASGLKGLLADYLGVTPDMIVTGCGSDDVIDSAIRAFAEPGDRLVHPHPTFHMAATFARMNGLEPVGVPLSAAWEVDPDALWATGARVVYLCSPNNPTGTSLSRRSIERILDGPRGLVILDEAYAEYAEANALDLLGRSDRLLITRTMSKAFGLAGLRIGYAAGAPALVAEVEKSRGPYKVNLVAERAAHAALGEGRAWVTDRVREAVACRQRLTAALEQRGLRPLASAANFLLVPVPRSMALMTQLRAAGVAVRPYVGLPRIGDAIRVTVGPWPLMAAFLDALDGALNAALAGGGGSRTGGAASETGGPA
jgi:histidinol-phosphate aminotransferase